MFIFIDLDDTILDFHKAEAVALKKTLLTFGIAPTDETVALYSSINDKMWKLLEKGEMTMEQILVKRFQLLFETLKVFADSKDANETYKLNLSKGHWFIDGAKELLTNLYKKHDLYIVSNGTTSVQKGRIESANIKKYFKDIFLSQDIGYNKPDIRFFQKCFNKIDGFNKEDAIILGDSLSSDISGGINAKIKTCWFNPNNEEAGDIKPDYTITSLTEFLEIV